MADLLKTLRETLLMGPGPSMVSPAVYRAIAQPTIGHLDPAFIGLMDAVQEDLRSLLNTENTLTLPISGTGSAGMETCFVNLVEQGDRVLILSNGVFGTRMAEVAGRLGAEVDSMDFEWGAPVDTQQVAARLKEKKYDLIGVVHAETSTGVLNPVEQIGELARENGALYLVDSVTGLGGIPVKLDAWGVDAFYSGTQKCLSCPPGLSPVSFSARATEKLQSRKTKVPNWYLDLNLICGYWAGEPNSSDNKRAYHHTAPINMNYALYAALREIVNEGTDAVFERHLASHRQLVDGLEDRGLAMLVSAPHRLPMLNAVKIPQGVDEAAVRSILLNEHAIEIGAGLGPLAGKIWRIGLMGHTARAENVERLLAALDSAV
ncbi:MAG: alanine--glyoxylate aminotransferase family protein [Verrucomicrobiaceae bacterium]|nr:alanine--glyoxylate aminotransferase family protein [Verrucomicrobiaceae bacterium]